MDEAGLVGKAKSGCRQSFEALYRDQSGRIFALCLRLCGYDHALAADMVQEAFVRAWQKLGSFKGESAFGTWMHRLTVNLVLSERRKWVRRQQFEKPEQPDLPETSGINAVDGMDRDLERAISQLPERARMVLVLYEIEGYQHDEIADMAGIAVGTSKAQLHRARGLLRESLA